MSDSEANLLDFRWIRAELASGDVGTLLTQYQEPGADVDPQGAALVADALRLAAPVLTRDPDQLAAQLLGRLTTWDPAWGDLPNQAATWQGAAWLRPLQSSLTPAGGPRGESPSRARSQHAAPC